MASRSRGQFLCGVVEGFYGRPWSPEQRCDLFMHMSAWGMNVYLYAPKDDDKHRAYWRELYTLEEADLLSQLIQDCTNKGIVFVYAIAPGLDITFSSSEDVTLLKRKLDQVVALGCKSFALLFDDIECDMCPADEKVFPSFAHAQVTVTNEMYSHLDHPEVFLFCPTEYCASRALPSVSESQYLLHIGAELHPEVDIMWTGPKVISKLISLESIEELSQVIKRPPLIWDNLHANDYDQRRLFLGPYDGRSVALLKYLRGVLTNPNCEYGANYVAIHTLAQWSKCCEVLNKRASPTRQAMLLEMEGSPDLASLELSEDQKTIQLSKDCLENGDVHFYDPKQALMTSLKEWFSEFKIPRRKPEHYKPVKDATSIAKAVDAEQMGSDQEEVDTGVLLPSPPQVDGSLQEHSSTGPFTFEDLCLMVDYFYLPHQHGEQALHILEEFCWLKENAPGYSMLQTYERLKSGEDAEGGREVVKGVEKMEPSDGLRSDGEASESPAEEEMSVVDVSHWCDKASKFHALCTRVSDMYARLTTIPNRPLLYDLYQYSWDAKETTMLLDSYVAWLEAGGSDVNPEHEPHVPKGGITAEMQRMLPQVQASKKLYGRGYKAPDHPSPVIYTIRPYRADDKALVYQTCLETGNSGTDATVDFPNYPNMLGDRFVGPYTTLSPDLAFVLEDDQGVCGYMLAALDSETFYKQYNTEWLPMIANDYPSPPLAPKPTPEEELLEDLFRPKFYLPPRLQREFPSHMHIDLMKRAQGQGVGTRMIKTLLATLKAKGSHGVHLEMSATNDRAKHFYKKIGFKVLRFEYSSPGEELPPEDVLVLGRPL